MLRSVRDCLLSLAFPRFCAVCGNEVGSYDDGRACARCWSRVRTLTGMETACGKCGRILDFKPSGVVTFCRRCGDHRYDLAVSAGIYEGALKTTVLELKERPHLPAKARLMFLRAFDHSPFYNSTLLIPVPLSRRRRLERGFNQAEILANHIFRRTGIPLNAKLLLRPVHAPLHRVGMDRKARAQSVKNAFQIGDTEPAAGEEILLIDDVFTTGATASACAAVLKNAGAGTVSVLTLARTL